jgi:hypothetical protein
VGLTIRIDQREHGVEDHRWSQPIVAHNFLFGKMQKLSCFVDLRYCSFDHDHDNLPFGLPSPVS